MLRKFKAKRLKKLRLAAMLTQQELAEVMSMTSVTVSNWERGTTHPSSETVLKLAEFFEVDPSSFWDIRGVEELDPRHFRDKLKERRKCSKTKRK